MALDIRKYAVKPGPEGYKGIASIEDHKARMAKEKAEINAAVALGGQERRPNASTHRAYFSADLAMTLAGVTADEWDAVKSEIRHAHYQPPYGWMVYARRDEATRRRVEDALNERHPLRERVQACVSCGDTGVVDVADVSHRYCDCHSGLKAEAMDRVESARVDAEAFDAHYAHEAATAAQPIEYGMTVALHDSPF